MELGQGGTNSEIHMHRNWVPYTTEKTIFPAYLLYKIVILTMFFRIVAQEDIRIFRWICYPLAIL